VGILSGSLNSFHRKAHCVPDKYTYIPLSFLSHRRPSEIPCSVTFILWIELKTVRLYHLYQPKRSGEQGRKSGGITLVAVLSSGLQSKRRRRQAWLHSKQREDAGSVRSCLSAGGAGILEPWLSLHGNLTGHVCNVYLRQVQQHSH